MIHRTAAEVGGTARHTLEVTFYEDVAVGGFHVAYPREGAAVVYKLAVICEQAAAAEDGVSVADQFAVLHVDGTVGLQSVARAGDADAV